MENSLPVLQNEIQNPLNFVNNFSEVSNELIDEMKTEFKKGDTEEGFAMLMILNKTWRKFFIKGKRADAIVKGMLQHAAVAAVKRTNQYQCTGR
ncbi:MAG: hypothetical protein IPF69_06700 [Chitinophagaceae bacterium]|nr:hypothetical protein [Chitinophagaceae bacterium]